MTSFFQARFLSGLSSRLRVNNRDEVLLELVFWGLLLSTLIYHASAALTGELLAGWDLVPHRYAFERMLMYLEEGRITGYNPYWFAGYPEFSLYGPAAYIIAALPYFLSFGLIEPGLSFNLTCFAIPLAFVFAFRQLVRAAFPEVQPWLAVGFAIVFLITPMRWAAMGLGLGALYSVGLFTNWISLPFVCLYLRSILSTREDRSSLRSALFTGLILAIVVTTSFLSAIFLFWAALVLIMSRPKIYFRPILLSGLVATLLASPSLIEIWRHLSISSSEVITWIAGAPHPLYAAIPNLQRLLTYPQEVLKTGITSVPTFLLLPLLFVASLVAALHGAKTSQRIRDVAVLWIASILCLPDDFLVGIIPIALHYYRFLQPILILSLILFCVGFQRMLTSSRHPRILACLLLFATSFESFVEFSLTPPHQNPYGHISPGDYPRHLTVDAYEKYTNASEILDYVANAKPTGRVAVEPAMKKFITLGSPHFFATELPRRYNIPVIPGLFAESSLTAPFAIGLVRKDSGAIQWGKLGIEQNHLYHGTSLPKALELLQAYGVQYLVTSTDTYRTRIIERAADQTSLAFESGGFAVFEMKDVKPFVSPLANKPILFLDYGGIEFIDFSEFAFLTFDQDEVSFVHNPKQPRTLPKNLDAFSFILVSVRYNHGPPAFLRDLPEDLPPILILGGESSQMNDLPKGVQRVMYEDRFHSAPLLTKAIEQLLKENPLANEAVSLTFNEAEETMMVSGNGPILIRYSYAPRWENLSGGEIYWATPSTMMVFSEEKTELSYQ